MSEASNKPAESESAPAPGGSNVPSKLKLTALSRNRLAGYFDLLAEWKLRADKKKAAASAAEPPSANEVTGKVADAAKIGN
ncbi:MAG: hypothetical protein DPW14_05605 [Planctomycetes bacterium]|nr:hypothetical protein [Planctomycetota bacterium]